MDLPFRLRVPNRDAVTLTEASSTTFRFEGRLGLTPAGLHLRWRGVAKVEAVGLTGVRDEELPLPLEELDLPLASLASIALRGGWFWPNVELMGADMDTLGVVPGESLGRVRLWIARSDRRLARQLVETVRASMGPWSVARVPITDRGPNAPTPPEGTAP